MIHQDVTQQLYEPDQAATIKLIGVGGGGCNAVEHMIGADIHGVDFTLVNTDAQALARYHPDNIIQLGNSLTRGLGAGTDPEIGRMAAEEDADLIAGAIGEVDMLFLTAGMGGGTGTGAIPVIARIARELGVLTVAVVTKPFGFEGGKRRQVAEAGLAELRKHVDSLIVVPNENLLTHLGPNISLIEAFSASNDVLTNAVQSIAELITNPGLINVDFADVKSVMTETGEAMMSTGRGIGEYRARDAAIAATESPLLDEIALDEARGILANITASDSLSMGEFQIVGDILDQITAENANVVIGTVFDPEMSDEIRVTVVATGLKPAQRRMAPPPRGRKPSSTGFLGFGSRDAKEPRRKAARKGSKLRYKRRDSEAPATTRRRPRLVEDQYEEQQYQEQTYQEEQYEEQQYQAPQENRPAEREPIDVAPAPTPVFCQACGNKPDNHTANCPLADTKSDSPKKSRSFLLDDRNVIDDIFTRDNAAPRVQPAAEERVSSEPAPRVKNKAKPAFGTGKKRTSFNKHVAGLVAGALVLLSVFFVLTSNKVAVDNPTVASTSSSGKSDIAERKLREAQRRLSGLDDN